MPADTDRTNILPRAASSAAGEDLLARAEIILHAGLPLALYRVVDAAWTINRGFAEALELPLEPGASYTGDVAWGNGWDKVEPLIANILRGSGDPALYDRLVETKVNGRPRRRCWTFAFSPVRENDEIVAILALSAETTRQMHAEARLTFLLDLSERLRGADSELQAMEIVCEALTTRFGAAGAVFDVYADAANDSATVAWPADARWHAAFGGLTAPSASARTDSIEIADAADDSGDDPAFRAALRTQGLASLLLVPLWRDGRPVATLALVDDKPRYWSDDERDLIVDSLARAWDSLKRLRAEARARAAQDRFELLEQGNDVGLFDWDIITNRYYWSYGVYRVIGATPGTVEPGREAMTQRTDPEEIAAARAAMRDALAAGDETFLTEYRVFPDDGSPRWVQCDARIFRDHRGVAVRVAGLLRDITARRQRDDADAAERARAERAIKESERLLRAIGEASVDLIYAKDVEGRLLYANPATAAVLGEPIDALLGLPPHALQPQGDEGAAIGANDQNVIDSGLVQRFEEVATLPTGEPRLFLSTKSPMRDSEGRIVGLAGVSTDITDLRAAEALLRESEARFRTLAEHIPILCWMADPAGEAFWYNSQWYDYTGLTPDQSRGGGWRDVHDPQFLDEINARWIAARASGELFEMLFPLRGRDGSYQPFLTRVAPIRDEQGTIVRWFGTHTNVSEVEALRRTEAIHELVLESAADFAIVTMTDAGTVVSWNRGAENIFGWTAAEIAGQSIDRLMRPPARAAGAMSLATMFGDAIASGRSETTGERWRRDGQRIWVTGVLMPLRDPDGRHRGFLEIARDSTDERRQEEHRLLLVAELNHRVKNTLAIVQGIAQQSFRPDADPIESRRLFEGRLGALASAHNLLTRESWEAADIVDIVADAIVPYDPTGERFTVDGPSVRLEPQLSVTMAMALNELCTNARKYGALSVDAGHVDIDWTFTDGTLDLVWRESGGPEVGAPLRRGFGTRLIERAMAGYRDGAATIAFPREGLVCRFRVRVVAEGD